MSSSAILIIVLAVAVVIAVIAWLLYKAGFRVTEITAKFPWLEAIMKRKPDADGAKPVTDESGPSVSQQAAEGGVIQGSGITAPAQSKAQIDQKSEGEGSRIDDSPIKLT